MIVEIWACPTPGCGNYYGASSAGDLASIDRPVSRQNGQSEGSRGKRSRCPRCETRGQQVDRVLHRLEVTP